MKKYLAILLAVCLCITAFSSVMLVSAETTFPVETVDLSKSNVAMGNGEDLKGTVTLTPSGTSLTVKYNQYKQRLGMDQAGKDLWLKGAIVTLKDSGENCIFLESGKSYVINVQYSVDKNEGGTDWGSQIALEYNNNTGTGNAVNGDNGQRLIASNKHTAAGNYSLTSGLFAGNNKPIRLAFAGQGTITVKSVTVQTVETETDNIDLKLSTLIKDDVSYMTSYSLANATDKFNVSLSATAQWSAFTQNGTSTLKTGTVKDAVRILLSLKKDNGDCYTLDSHYNYKAVANYRVLSYGTATTKNMGSYPAVAFVINDNNQPENYYKDNGSIILAQSAYYGDSSVVYSVETPVIDGATYAGKPLRVAFAGRECTIQLESVSITATPKSVAVVNYVDNGITTGEMLIPGTPLKTPAGTGCEFLGWYDNANFTGSPVTVASGDMTVYAKWSPLAVVNVDLTKTPILNQAGDSANTVVAEDGVVKMHLSFFQRQLDQSGQVPSANPTWYPNYAVQDYQYTVGSKAIVKLDYTVRATPDGNFGSQIGIATWSGTGGSNMMTKTSSRHQWADIDKSFTLYACYNVASSSDKIVKIATSGGGNIDITGITLYELKAEGLNDYSLVNFRDGDVSEYEFVKNNETLKTPAAKEGCTFVGWVDNSGNKVESVSADATLIAQWLTEKETALENSTRICDPSDPSKDKAKLTISYPADVDGMKVAFEEYSKNYAILNNDGTLNTGTVWAKGGMVALKDENGNYIKFAPNNKYVVNVTYDITRLCTQDEYYAPQVGLCYNDNVGNDGSDNGAKMLAAKRHLTCGSYTLSAVINGSKYDYKPLRLIFDGVGECVIKSVTVESADAASATHFAVKLSDGITGTDVAGIFEVGSAVPALNRTAALNFGGWFNGADKVTTVVADGELSAKWFDRKDINGDEETSILDLVKLDLAIKAGTSDLWFDVDRDESFGESDLVVLFNERLGRTKPTVNDNDMADYSIFVCNKSLMVKKAAEAIASAVESATDLELPIVDTETAKEFAVVVDETMDKDAYAVAFDGDKLVIAAGSDYAVSTAARKVADYISLNGYIPSSFSLEGEYDANYSMVGNFKYAWGDEFDGTALDTNKWTFSDEVKNGPFYASNSAYYTATSGNSTWTTNGSYKQDGTLTYVNNDYSVNDGVLTLNTRKTANGYTGTKISAKDTFRYGIMEAKVKFGEGAGATYEIWARSKDTSPKEECVVNEFDFAENFGTTDIRPNLHTWRQYTNHTNHGNEITKRDSVANVTDGEYHYIAMEWTANFVRFYFDGELYLEQNISDQATWDAFRKSTYMIFAVDVPGGTYAIDSDGTTPAEQILANGGSIADLANFSDSLSVDFVRVYQLGSSDYTLSK